MKKIILTVILLTSITIWSHAQTYYYMWRGSGEAGKPEWIANSRLTYPFTGIQFQTADIFRGAVTGNGRWLFWDPFDPVTTEQNVCFIVDNLSKINHCALGTHGTIVADRYVMTDLSSSGNIDSYYGYGRNGDVMISCQMQKWLRLNSYSGIACWGNGGGATDDNPHLLIASNYIEARTPFVQKNGEITHIKNNITTTLNSNSAGDAAWFGTTTDHGIEFGTNGKTALYIGNGQNVFLGFDKTGADKIDNKLKGRYNVFVKTGVLSADYAIVPTGTWADFVFDNDYHLRPIHELEQYIDSCGHLPDVPSAEEVAADGYSQHEINKALLQKIEELTLYIIEQQKEIDTLKKLISDKNNKLK